MLKLDPNSGNIIWKFQPVPFDMDDDPDWASGPTLVNSGGGPVAVSTQKDGWSYAVGAGGTSPVAPPVWWQFPATGYPFSPGDGTTHDDTRYQRPGAAWGDVFITETGGEAVTTDVQDGYFRLHALNITAGGGGRVRWQLRVPNTNTFGDYRYRLGPPSVTHGIVFVGTSEGHLVAIADPSVWPSVGSKCSLEGVPLADCESMGYQIVPNPAILLNLTLPNADVISTEPALAGGKVFIANDAGWVYMIAP
jgi:outer membrane protein assembly factor BamB